MGSILRALKSGDINPLRKYKVNLTMLKEYRSRPGDSNPLETFRIHRKGFTVADWDLLGMTDENREGYLSSKQYYSLHPYNGTYSSWIDDKLTLWYLCRGTELAQNMPVYYFQIDGERIMPLTDGDGAEGAEAIVRLLEKLGTLALKKVKGSIGRGFYKAEFRDGAYFLNDERLTRDELCSRASALDGYIVCEYLRPHEELAKVFPNTPNTFRYLACRIDGKLRFLKSFIRFGSSSTGYVEAFNQGGILCYIDEEGAYGSGYAIDRSDGLSTKIVTFHPDTGAVLGGTIPLWDKVQEAVTTFDKLFPQLDYVGFDFVITDDDRVIILEINSLTSLDCIQLDCSLLDTEVGKAFFGPKLAKRPGKATAS